MENRNYIDGLSLVLAAYERNELSFMISSEDVEKLQKTYVQMCNGLNPTTKQKQLAEQYISYNVEILHGKKDWKLSMMYEYEFIGRFCEE